MPNETRITQQRVLQMAMWALLTVIVIGAGAAGISQTEFMGKFGRSLTIMSGSGGWTPHDGQTQDDGRGSEGRMNSGDRPSFPGKGGGFQQRGDSGNESRGDAVHGNRFHGHAFHGGNSYDSPQEGSRQGVSHGFLQVAGYTGIMILMAWLTVLLSRLSDRIKSRLESVK